MIGFLLRFDFLCLAFSKWLFFAFLFGNDIARCQRSPPVDFSRSSKDFNATEMLLAHCKWHYNLQSYNSLSAVTTDAVIQRLYTVDFLKTKCGRMKSLH